MTRLTNPDGYVAEHERREEAVVKKKGMDRIEETQMFVHRGFCSFDADGEKTCEEALDSDFFLAMTIIVDSPFESQISRSVGGRFR